MLTDVSETNADDAEVKWTVGKTKQAVLYAQWQKRNKHGHLLAAFRQSIHNVATHILPFHRQWIGKVICRRITCENTSVLHVIYLKSACKKSAPTVNVVMLQLVFCSLVTQAIPLGTLIEKGVGYRIIQSIYTFINLFFIDTVIMPSSHLVDVTLWNVHFLFSATIMFTFFSLCVYVGWLFYFF